MSCSIVNDLSPPSVQLLPLQAAPISTLHLLKAFVGGFWGKLFLFSLYLLGENVSYTIA